MMDMCKESMSRQPGPPECGIRAKAWMRQMAFWNRERTEKRGNLNSRRFWNGFDLWDSYEPHTRYPGKLMGPILEHLDGQTTVLDVGAGSGGLALPMAMTARSVTAVEPSSAQCERLRRKAEDLNINNLVVVENAWEDAGTEALGLYDIVTAGYCLFMADIVKVLWKMYRLARNRIFLVHLAAHDLQGAMAEVSGRRTPFPDHFMLLDLLHEMGWKVRSQTFTRDFVLPLDLQMEMFRYAQGFKDAEVKEMKDHLQKTGRIFMRGGEAWVNRRYEDALLSVSKATRD